MKAIMRAKMRVAYVTVYTESKENVIFEAVCKAGGIDKNTLTPKANLDMDIKNPDLYGKFKVGDEFYVDFTRVEKKNQENTNV